MTVWFTADTHFGHERTLELSRRPFATVNNMDKYMINNWNEVVAPTDTVIHLGDFGDYRKSFALNGKIHLLLGNYERDELRTGKMTMEKLRSFRFQEVWIKPLIEGNFEGLRVSLVHEPSHMDPDTFNLFGHIHKLQMVRRNGLNVGMDCHNFTPVDIDTVQFYKTAIENHYDEEVFGSK